MMGLGLPDSGTDRIRVPEECWTITGSSIYEPKDVATPDEPTAFCPVGQPVDDPVPDVTPRVEVLFCIDTTGSMSDELDRVRANIQVVDGAARKGIPQPDIRYALVTYRDIGCGYVTKVWDFMDHASLLEVLSDIDTAYGGDYPESVGEGLWCSVHDVSWDTGPASRAIYLIGDAPPHNDSDSGRDHIAAARAAAERGIVVNAIGCSGIVGYEEAFRKVAEITGGNFTLLEYYWLDMFWIEDCEASMWPTANEEGTPEDDGSGDAKDEGGGQGQDGGQGSSPDENSEGQGQDQGQGRGQGQPQIPGSNLLEFLTELIKAQCRSQGVDYGDDDL